MNWLSDNTIDQQRDRYRIYLDRFLGLLLFVVAIYSSLVQAELYKYINNEGVTVLDSSVPVAFINNGYTILSNEGRVIKVVPRALSPDEVIERDKRLAAAEQAATREAEREEADRDLMRIYSNPEDVTRARNTKIASVEGFIRSSESNLNRLLSQKRTMEAQFANIERAGGVISIDKLDQMRVLQQRISQSNTEIDLKRDEVVALNLAFDADFVRVKTLYQRETNPNQESSMTTSRQ